MEWLFISTAAADAIRLPNNKVVDTKIALVWN